MWTLICHWQRTPNLFERTFGENRLGQQPSASFPLKLLLIRAVLFQFRRSFFFRRPVASLAFVGVDVSYTLLYSERNYQVHIWPRIVSRSAFEQRRQIRANIAGLPIICWQCVAQCSNKNRTGRKSNMLCSRWVVFVPCFIAYSRAAAHFLWWLERICLPLSMVPDPKAGFSLRIWKIAFVFALSLRSENAQEFI